MGSRVPPNARILHERLAARLKSARLRAGLSQTDAARAAGVCYQQYNKYELGLNRVTAVTLYHLAGAFRLPIDWFFAESAAPVAAPGGRAHARMSSLFSAIPDRMDQSILLDLAARFAAMPPAPVADPAAERVLPCGPVDPPGEGDVRHILLVDDDADALCVTGVFLRKAGFAVTTASSGDDALRLLAARRGFDALVTDYSMPGLNGLALIELVAESFPDLPALVITGYGRDGTLDRVPPHVKVLNKPYSRNLLLSCVAQLVKAPPRGIGSRLTHERPISP